LDNLRRHPSPSLTISKDIVAPRNEIAWFKKKVITITKMYSVDLKNMQYYLNIQKTIKTLSKLQSKRDNFYKKISLKFISFQILLIYQRVKVINAERLQNP